MRELYGDCRNPQCRAQAWAYDAGRLGYCRACRAMLWRALAIGALGGWVFALAFVAFLTS